MERLFGSAEVSHDVVRFEQKKQEFEKALSQFVMERLLRNSYSDNSKSPND